MAELNWVTLQGIAEERNCFKKLKDEKEESAIAIVLLFSLDIVMRSTIQLLCSTMCVHCCCRRAGTCNIML